MQKVLQRAGPAGEDRRRHPDGHGDARPAEERPRQRDARLRQHLLRPASSTSCSSRPTWTGKCAIVTSYRPSTADIKGEESGEGADRAAAAVRDLPEDARRLVQRAGETAMNKVEEFEKEVKKNSSRSQGR